MQFTPRSKHAAHIVYGEILFCASHTKRKTVFCWSNVGFLNVKRDITYSSHWASGICKQHKRKQLIHFLK